MNRMTSQHMSISVTALIVFFSVGTVYLMTMHPTVAGGDCGELMGAAHELGNPHPPGYPTFAMYSYAMEYIATSFIIPIYRAVTGKAIDANEQFDLGYIHNLAHTLLSTTSVVFLYLSIIYLVNRTSYEASKIEYFFCTASAVSAACLGAGVFAFSPSVWLYAIHTEVFPLNNLFTTVLVLLTVIYGHKLCSNGTLLVSHHRRFVSLSALFCGFGLTNQHTLVVFEGPIALWVLLTHEPKKVKRWLSLAALFLLGLTPYLYGPLVSYIHYRRGGGSLDALLDDGSKSMSKISSGYIERIIPEQNYFAVAAEMLTALLPGAVVHGVPALSTWGNLHTWKGFWKHFLRAEYGTFSLASQESTYKVYNFQQMWIKYLEDVGVQTSGFWILAVFGLLTVLRELIFDPFRCCRAEAILILVWITYSCFFNFLSNMPLDSPLHYGVQQRFWIQPLCIVCIFIGIGAYHCLVLIARRMRSKSLGIGLPILCGIAAVSYHCSLHFRENDESANYYIRNLGKAILDSVPTNAVVLTSGDLYINSIRYMQSLENYRTDVVLIDMELLTYKWYNDVLKRHPTVKERDVIIPGDHYYMKSGRYTNSYTIADFLIYNFQRSQKKGKKSGAKPLRIFLTSSWKEGDESWQDLFTTRRWGLINEIVYAHKAAEYGIQQQAIHSYALQKYFSYEKNGDFFNDAQHDDFADHPTKAKTPLWPPVGRYAKFRWESEVSKTVSLAVFHGAASLEKLLNPYLKDMEQETPQTMDGEFQKNFQELMMLYVSLNYTSKADALRAETQCFYGVGGMERFYGSKDSNVNINSVSNSASQRLIAEMTLLCGFIKARFMISLWLVRPSDERNQILVSKQYLNLKRNLIAMDQSLYRALRGVINRIVRSDGRKLGTEWRDLLEYRMAVTLVDHLDDFDKWDQPEPHVLRDLFLSAFKFFDTVKMREKELGTSHPVGDKLQVRLSEIQERVRTGQK